MQHYLIVGAGIAGLAAAVRLRAKGYTVCVVEANPYVGGKLSSIELGGYRFDAGPSLFTMPQYVDELFRLAGKNPKDYFDYQALDIVCQYFWEDGTLLSAHADQEAFAQEAAQKLGIEAEVLRRALRRSRFKYEATEEVFLQRSLHRLSTYFTKGFVKALVALPWLDIFTTMNKANERELKHPKLVQLFNRYATYNGSDPYQASGILNLIPHLEHGLGAYMPKGGMRAIAQSIYRLAQDMGVEFKLSTMVEEILVENHRAVGLRLSDGDVLVGDGVVCNMDVFFAYRKLLPKQPQPERILSQGKSSSALIFYWGIKHQFEQLQAHNIFFSEQYEAEFRAIFQEKRLFEDPTVYINITSRHEPGDAPKGCDNWFVMINVPHLAQGQDWDKWIPEARQRILDKLSRMLGQPIEPLIEAEAILEPRTIEQRTRSHLGSLYGTSSNSRSAAFFRHPNFSNSIDHLYFCGGSVHPGGGIPLCLLSAKIATDLVKH
jgi:phytoene desaturase